jgi:hypothetical protein
MQPHGGDRVRAAGDTLILHSRISKGWTAGTPKCPGTAVQWEESCYEVLGAELLPAGGVRYVLRPWSDSATIRTFYVYDAVSEDRLRADFELAQRQRKYSVAARIAGFALGHLPSHVQEHYANELGLFPARMTLLSIVPSMIFVGTCVWLIADAMLRQVPSPVPLWVLGFAMVMLGDSAARFLVAMSQRRGIGSLPGTILYSIYRLFAKKPPAPQVSSTFMIPPSEEIRRSDSLEMRSAFLTLLRPEEQRRIAERHGFDYRRHAAGVAWTLLACAAIGAISMVMELRQGAGISALVSLVSALLVILEQAFRLRAFPHGPAGSVFGVLVRPFARDLLARN